MPCGRRAVALSGRCCCCFFGREAKFPGFAAKPELRLGSQPGWPLSPHLPPTSAFAAMTLETLRTAKP